MKKPCWRQLPISKSLFLYDHRDSKKGCFRYKTEKVNTTTEFHIFELVQAPNFNLNWQLWFFGPNLPNDVVFGLKEKKWTPHWILYIGISLDTKIQLELTIFIFRTKFAQKRHFWSKAEKMNITTKFCIFELVCVPISA